MLVSSCWRCPSIAIAACAVVVLSASSVKAAGRSLNGTPGFGFVRYALAEPLPLTGGSIQVHK